MSQYAEISCPGCQQTLRVRKQYAGSQVSCKHCEHIFEVDLGDQSPTADPELAARLEQLVAELEAIRQERDSLEEQVQSLQAELEQQRNREDEHQQRLAALEQEVETLRKGQADPGEPNSPGNESQERLDSLKLQFDQEREALQKQVEQYQRESARLRQALESMGVRP